MNSQIQRGYGYMNRSLYSAASPTYYEWKQFPVKYSLQHFLHHKKIKHRVQQISRQCEIAKSFDVVEAKIKILKAQKNQYGFPFKSTHKPPARIVENLKKRVYTESIDKIPELSIEKQPIRCQTECDRKKLNIRYSNCEMRVIRKRNKSEKSMSPVSKSIVLLVNPEQQKITHMMTQLVTGNESLDICKLGIKSRKNVKHLKKQTRKVKTQNASKRSYRSDDKIKGWDVRHKDYDETVLADAK